jgi:hypothetical protein
MARVVSTGAVVTVSHWEGDAAQTAPLNLHLRLYAKLDNGLLAIDPNPQTAGMGVDRSRIGDAENLRAMSKLSLSWGQLPP